ncbi:MAG: D-glycero-beta-D-manno-heptose 1-phosphate adenylyltransferase [Pyrinomonadaceae bacterium]|nr:D-glycero-beta-D-manno-heptose 1-phosphate adenylyltransferase [Pyrinomonadaceae bacterium]
MEAVVFTNGCFDILHPGHLELLEKAKKLGSKLIVGINSDESVRAIKGNSRPFVSENDRANVLRGLRCVDEVIIFNEPTPQQVIEKIKPDILVKGGDWSIDQIIGAEFVKKNGGEVYSIPLKEGYSSSSIVEKITNSQNSKVKSQKTIETLFEKGIKEHLKVFETLRQNDILSIEKCSQIMVDAVKRGNKILLCGNGGSAGDAQHIATELVGRYEKERKGLPAIALTTDTSALTAIGNDYGFERIFSRQVEALANPGDVLVGISTSGNSPNVILAIMEARQKGCQTIGLTGAKGKKLASLCDAAVLVPSERTARIQEAHLTIGHLWCEMVEANF